MEKNIFVLSERFENHFIFLKREQFLLTPVLISLQNQEQLIKRVEKSFWVEKKVGHVVQFNSAQKNEATDANMIKN